MDVTRRYTVNWQEVLTRRTVRDRECLHSCILCVTSGALLRLITHHCYHLSCCHAQECAESLLEGFVRNINRKCLDGIGSADRRAMLIARQAKEQAELEGT